MEEKSGKRLIITISGKRRYIHIWKSVIKALDYPYYICLRIAKDKKSMAILPCKEDSELSVKVPDEFLFTTYKASLRICSKSFCDRLIYDNKWDYDTSYNIEGKLRDDKRAVVFYLDDAKPIPKEL